MKCVLEKPPSKHKSIRLVPAPSRGTESVTSDMRRQNKKWGGETDIFQFSSVQLRTDSKTARCSGVHGTRGGSATFSLIFRSPNPDPPLLGIPLPSIDSTAP